jgi:hypothetical protein
MREIQREAADQREAAELVTPFTVEPGVPLSTVDLMPAFDAGEIKIGLTLPDGSQQVRVMPNRRHTHELVFAYAQHAARGIVPHGVKWSS